MVSINELSKELNDTVALYFCEENENKKKVLKEKIDSLSYYYVKEIVAAYLIKTSSAKGYKPELIEDVSSELYVNRIANPKLQVLENFNNQKASYHTYISNKVIPCIYDELRRLSVVKISDTQNRYLSRIKRFLTNQGADLTNPEQCNIYKEEVYEELVKTSRSKKIKKEDFEITWLYFFNRYSNIPIVSGSIQEGENAIELESDKGYGEFDGIELLEEIDDLLNEAKEFGYITNLEAELFKIEICDMYALDCEDKYNLRNRYNSSVLLEEAGYKLLVTGLLGCYFPELEEKLIKHHPNKYKKYKERYELQESLQNLQKIS